MLLMPEDYLDFYSIQLEPFAIEAESHLIDYDRLTLPVTEEDKRDIKQLKKTIDKLDKPFKQDGYAKLRRQRRSTIRKAYSVA